MNNISSLFRFYYSGFPLGPLSTFPKECQKDYYLKDVDTSSMADNDNPVPAVAVAVEKPQEKKKHECRLPPDSLFWNLFIAIYGEGEFFQIGTKYANREWEEKNRIRQEIAKNPKSVQTTNHKLTLKNVQEMMSEYMTGVSHTSLLGLVGFSVYYKIPIYLIDPVKKTHLSFLPTNTDKEPCFLVLRDGRYELATEPISLGDSFGLESYTRPLRAISSYKRAELEEIRTRFRVNLSDKSKEALYRALSEHLVWK